MSTFEQDVYTIFNQAVYKDIVNLYKNGEFYQQNDELEGALISYSSCASMIHTILQINYDCTPKCTTPVSTSVSLDLPGPQISDNGEHPAGVQLSNATTDTRVNIKASSSQDNNTKDLPPTYDFLEKLKASFIQTLEKKYQTILSRVEQLQKKLKDKKQTLKNSNAEDDEEEWLQACTKIHPAIFKDGSKDCIFFKDLAGLQKQKDQIKKALIQPLIYENLYPKVGKGFLLYGPPGTGKTLLVKAAVNELQLEDENVRVLFFAPTGATLKGKYVGDTEKRIVEAYKCASLAACKCEKNNPEKKYISVIFIDEIDSIAGDRNKDETGLMANSVNTLLQVIDGLESPANVATIGATNYPWQLDAAVLRRFDTQILLGLPDSPQIEKAMNISFNKFIKLKLSDWKDGCSKLQRYLQDDSNKETQNKTSKKENDACAKGCSFKSNTVDIYQTTPYNIFKYSYTDSDTLIRAISDELSSDTKYFSFSDVDKVMGLAKTLTATTSLEYTFYNPSKTIPELLTLKGDEDSKLLSNFYLSSINKPRDINTFSALLTKYYEKLNNLVDNKYIIATEAPTNHSPSSSEENEPDVFFDAVGNGDAEEEEIRRKAIINQEKLLDFYQHFHISKFPKYPYIKKNSKTYYNSKLLFDLDPNLLIEDPNINDVYIYCQTEYLKHIYEGKWNELEKLSKKKSKPIIDIETINCLNLEYSQRKNILEKLSEKNLLKTEKNLFKKSGRNIYDSKVVDIIVSVKRTVKSQTTKNVEYENNIMSLGLGSYLKNKLDYKINAYLCKSFKFISSARKHLEYYLRNIHNIHDFENNQFDNTVLKYKRDNNLIDFRDSIVAYILKYTLTNSFTINTEPLQNCKSDKSFQNFMNSRMDLKDFLLEKLNFKCEKDLFILFKNIRFLLKNLNIKKGYEHKINQIKLIFEAFSNDFNLNDGAGGTTTAPSPEVEEAVAQYKANVEKFKNNADIIKLYTSNNILNVFDSNDINVLLRANISELKENPDNSILNNLFTKFMNKIYDKVEKLYIGILNKRYQLSSQRTNMNFVELTPEEITEFEQKTSYINEFFVEKIPFITNNVFNKFSYEKQLSIELLKLVNRAKDNLDKTIEDQKRKDLATNLLNYQSYLSIVLNILASSKNELLLNQPGINSMEDTDCCINLYFPDPIIYDDDEVSTCETDVGSNRASNDCFRMFLICFYNIWKNNINEVQKDKDITLHGFNDIIKVKNNMTLNDAIEATGDYIQKDANSSNIYSGTQNIYAYYLSSEHHDNFTCSKTTKNINSSSKLFKIINNRKELSKLTERRWISKYKNIFFNGIDDKIVGKDKNKLEAKCVKFFDVGRMQFSFQDNLSKTLDYSKLWNGINRTLYAIGCLSNNNGSKCNIVYNHDTKLFENKSKIPTVFEFLYECKLDTNNENYRGILKTKSFIRSGFTSIFKLVSDLYNSGKKPRMSEFRSLAKRIKKMNPDITVLHYILRLTHSVGIISPFTKNIFWSNIKNEQIIETTSQSFDEIYEELYGISPEIEEAQLEKEKWDATKSLGVYTGASTLGTLLYGAGTLFGIATGGVIVAGAVVTLAFLAMNIRDRHKESGNWTSAIWKEVGIAVIGGVIGSGVGHIINRKIHGEGKIAYQIPKTITRVKEEFMDDGGVKKIVEEIDNPDYGRTGLAYIEMPIVGLESGLSAIGSLGVEMYKKARHYELDFRYKQEIVSYLKKGIDIVKFNWPVSANYLITFALAYPSIKSLYKNIMGYSSTPLFNEALIDSIGPYGNDDIIFDISTEDTFERYAKSVSDNLESIDNMAEKKKIELKGDFISRAYLTAYLRKINKDAFESSAYYNLTKLADFDFTDFDYPSMHEKMQDVISPNSTPDVNYFIREGSVYTSFIVEFDRTEFGPEINSIVSSNQKKLKIIDILPDKIKIAASEQPQSYDPILGGMLNDYSENRLKFLEDFKNGKYNKKTG